MTGDGLGEIAVHVVKGLALREASGQVVHFGPIAAFGFGVDNGFVDCGGSRWGRKGGVHGCVLFAWANWRQYGIRRKAR